MPRLALPRFRRGAIAVWRRDVLVWRRLIGPALLMNFGEPALYLLGLGYGLGFFIGEIAEMPYLMFLASGVVASSAMNTASFEGMYSVYTRMVPQKTYEAILTTPLEVDDIVAGEMLWCGTKSVISSIAILTVASAIGVVEGWQALWVVPVAFLTGLCFAGPAIMMSAAAGSYDFFNYYTVLVLTPMLLISGVFYPVDTLPAIMQSVVDFLPLVHAVDLARPLMAGLPIDTPLVHVGVLALYAATGYYLAVVLVRRRLVV